MAEFILKAAPDVDLYGLFSTVSDAIDFIGDRAEMETFLSTPTAYRGVEPLASVNGPEASLERADATGTSLLYGLGPGPLRGAWDHPGIDVTTSCGGWGFLRRDRFHAYFAALQILDTETAEALLEPADFNNEEV